MLAIYSGGIVAKTLATIIQKDRNLNGILTFTGKNNSNR
jgi:hypothetical protein